MNWVDIHGNLAFRLPDPDKYPNETIDNAKSDYNDWSVSDPDNYPDPKPVPPEGYSWRIELKPVSNFSCWNQGSSDCECDPVSLGNGVGVVATYQLAYVTANNHIVEQWESACSKQHEDCAPFDDGNNEVEVVREDRVPL
ncbi:hypothetical protein HNR46_000902 [Haloferula luteola]|uniref:Uncharacterized protein n=1 Tax=Haloferula luteola TaxID=595692 RepID=A0A840V4W3_9BACT|nr:hypothetical protein [Haloferula luteola]